MEKLFENIDKIELISYFSCEIICFVGILINILMFLFFSRKYNIKRLSDIVTFGVFTLSSLISLGIYLTFKISDFSIFNNLIVFNSENLLLKFLIYLFLTLFVLMTYKTTRKARFRGTISNSCLLFLAISSTLLIQNENKILTFFLLDVCSFFIYKFASNTRIRKPDTYCIDFVLTSSVSSILFYLFWGLTYTIQQELQLSIIQSCMFCALLLKAGLFPIYNYSTTKKIKNNLAYSTLLFSFLPFLGVVSFIKFLQNIVISDEIYLIVLYVFMLITIITSALCAFQTKNLIKFLANLSCANFSFYIIAILSSHDITSCLNSSAILCFAIFALYSILAILKINEKSKKINLELINGFFLKSRGFCIIFSIGLLIISNVIPSLIFTNNLEILKTIYQFDKVGFWAIISFIFANILILLNSLRIIKVMYSKKDFTPTIKLTKRTTLNYVVPCVIILVLILGMFL